MSEQPGGWQGAPREPRRVLLRRRPRYGVFAGAGALLGVVAAVVLTVLGGGTGGTGAAAAAGGSAGYSTGAVLGYLVVALGCFGALLGTAVGVVGGIVVERRARRR